MLLRGNNEPMTERATGHARDSAHEHDGSKSRSHDGLAATLQQGRLPESTHASASAGRAVSVAEIKNDCFVFAATIGKSIAHLADDLGIKRSPDAAAVRPAQVSHQQQIARPEQDEPSRFSSGDFRASKLNKFHDSAVAASSWDGDFNKQLNRLDGATAIKPEHADKLRAGITQNTDHPEKIAAVQPRFEGIASIEKHLAGTTPSAYAGVIADVVRKGAVELANGASVALDRSGIMRTAADAANEVSAIFQQACHAVLRHEANGKDFKDINIAQAAALATTLTGKEHSIVSLSGSDEAKAAQRAFGKPVLAEQSNDGSLRALFPGGDHRVEWKMRDGAPTVVPGSAREISAQVKLTTPRDRIGTTDDTEHRVPITAQEREQLSARMLAVRADQVHEALHRNTFGFPAADRDAMKNMLNSMTELDRTHLQRIYGAKYGADGEPTGDVLKRELREKLGSQDCAIVRNALDRQEGKPNDAGNFLVAIAGVNEGKAGSEKLLLQQLGSLSKPQIDQLDSDLRRTGTSLHECINTNPKLSPALRDSLPILSKGVEQRSMKDVLQLTEIAARDKNIDVMSSALGNSLPETVEAREHLQKLHADEWFKAAFQGHDRDLAMDYLLEGRISIATVANQSKQWFFNNKQDLMHSLDTASDDEKQAFRHGRALADQHKGEAATKLTGTDKEDLDYYNRVRTALRKGSSEREFMQCEAKLLYDNSLLDQLASKHSDGVLGTGFFGGHNKNELMTTVEGMSKEQIDQFKNKQYFDDFDNALHKFCSEEERVRIETLIEQKIGRLRTKAQIETGRPLHDIIDDNQTPEFAGLRIGRKFDGKAIIDGIKTMDINDREHYKNDAGYRTQVKQMLDGALEGPEKLLAQRMLAQVEKTGERPQFNAVDQVLYDAISPPSAIDAANHIQKAFAEDPTPDSEVRKYFSKAMYRSVLDHHHWMSQKEELDLEQKLMRDGRLSLDDRLKLCTNSSERLNEITHCTEPERQHILKHGLKDDIPIIGSLIGQLNDDQRNYAETVLRNRTSESQPEALEDRVRYHVVSSDRDFSQLEKEFGQATHAQKQHAREEYARKYNRDLDKDLLASVEDKDRLSFEKALKRVDDATQETFDTKLQALRSRSGLADAIVASGHWDGSRDELTRALDASATMQADRALNHEPLDPREVHTHNQFIAESHGLYQQAKENVTNVAVDSALTVGGIGASVCTGGLAAPLLIGAIGGGIAKPAMTAALQGEDFHPSALQLTKEIAVGSLTGALSAIGTEQVAELMQVGKVASSKTMQSVSGILGEATFKAGTKDAALQVAEKELAKKVQAGLGHVTEKDLNHVVDTLVKHGMNDQLKPVVRAKLAHELQVQLDHGTKNYLQTVVHNLPHLPKKLAAESALASSVEATTSATTQLSNWDDHASLTDNLETLTDRTIEATKHGAMMGLKASATHFFSAPAIDLTKSKLITSIQENPSIKKHFSHLWKPEDTLAASLYIHTPSDDPSDHSLIIPRIKDRPTIVIQDAHGFFKEIPNTKEHILKPTEKIHTLLKEGEYTTRDGTIITHQSARDHLLSLASDHLPDDFKKQRFTDYLTQFEQRIPDKREQALTAHELSRLFENRNRQLDHPRSIWLAEQLARQVADPLTIMQERWPTCNVTVVEVALASESPSNYTRLLSEVAHSGNFRHASGLVTEMVSNDTFSHDLNTLGSWEIRRTSDSQADLGEGHRSFASKIFQETAAQIRWDAEGGIIGNKYALRGEVRVKFKNIELMPYHNGQPIFYDGDFLRDPQIDSSFLPMIHNLIGGQDVRPLKVFEDKTAGKLAGIDMTRLESVSDLASFQSSIERESMNTWKVFVVDVTKGWLMDDLVKLSRSQGWPTPDPSRIKVKGHVILAKRIENKGFEIYNPWGPETHHRDNETISADELYSVLLREDR